MSDCHERVGAEQGVGATSRRGGVQRRLHGGRRRALLGRRGAGHQGVDRSVSGPRSRMCTWRSSRGSARATRWSRVFRYSGTHEGEWRRTAATGRRFENVDEVYSFTVRGERIVDSWGIEDTLTRCAPARPAARLSGLASDATPSRGRARRATPRCGFAPRSCRSPRRDSSVRCPATDAGVRRSRKSASRSLLLPAPRAPLA
jgi:hypothetical protein